MLLPSDNFPPIHVITDPFQILQGHEREVFMALFSDDGTLLVSTDGKDIRFWKRKRRRKYGLDRVIETKTRTISLAPQGHLIASIEEDRTFPNKVHLWSPDGEWVTALSHSGTECCCAFAPSESRLAIADRFGCLQLWDLAWDLTTFSFLCESGPPPESMRTFVNHTVRHLAFAPDGRRLAVQWNTRQGAVQVYSIEMKEQRTPPWQLTWMGAVAPPLDQSREVVDAFSFSPDGHYLALTSSAVCCVWLFDAFSLNLLGSFDLPTSAGYLVALAFSPEGSYLAMAGRKGTVWIGEVATHRLLLSFQAHTSVIESYASVIGSIAWSADGRLLMTTGMGIYEREMGQEVCERDYTLKLWQIKEKESGESTHS